MDRMKLLSLNRKTVRPTDIYSFRLMTNPIYNKFGLTSLEYKIFNPVHRLGSVKGKQMNR